MEAILLTATIDAYEGRDIIVLYVPNGFIQTNMPPKKYGKLIAIMKVTGVLVDMLPEMDIETYRNHVVFENGDKVIYFFVLREIYEKFVSALLFYFRTWRLGNYCILVQYS